MTRQLPIRIGAGLFRLAFAGLLAWAAIPVVSPWLPEGPLPVGAGAEALPPAPGQIVLQLDPNAAPAELAAIGARLGVQLAPAALQSGVVTAAVSPGDEDAAVERVQGMRGVQAAGRQYRYQASFVPNDPLYEKQWNLRMVNAEAAWKTTRGKGVTVAVIDTGVAIEDDHRCYRCRDFAETKFVRGYDFVNNDDHPADDHGHGTHVAGTIAESTNNREGAAGLAFEAAIMPIKVLDGMGGGRTSDIARGVRFAADNGAQVINMSLGGPFPDPVLRNACKYAVKKGVVVVCAAGNSSGGRVGYPAAYADCIAVSAVGPTGELAPYSSVGRAVALAGPGGDKSQGEDAGILQNTVLTDPDGARSDGYYSFQGTSMASPHVAATAALIISAGVKKPEEVRHILQKSARSKGPAEHYGAGLLDAGAAVKCSRGAGSAETPAAVLTGGGVAAVLAGAPAGALAFGAGAPVLAARAAGPGSPWLILIFSGLIPLYLLWECSGRKARKVLALFAAGYGANLAWSAFSSSAVFAGVTPAAAAPWLWANALLAFVVALVAYRRSHA